MSKKIILTAIFVMIILSSQGIFSQEKEVNIEELTKEATKHFADGFYPEAEEIFLKILENKPDDEVTFYNLACVYSRWAEILKDDEQQALKQKSFVALKNSVTLGYRELEHLLKDADFTWLRETDEFKQIVNDLKHLIEEEKKLEDAKPLKYKIIYSKENHDEQMPVIAFLEPPSLLQKNADVYDKFTADGDVTLIILSFADDTEKDKKSWDEFFEYRIHKTLIQIQEDTKVSKNLNFKNFCFCGIEQTGYSAMKTVLKLDAENKKALLINTSLFAELPEFTKLKELKNKAEYDFLIYHSSADTLACDDSVKNWKTLKDSGFTKFNIFTGDFGLNPFEILLENKKAIIDFLNKTD